MLKTMSSPFGGLTRTRVLLAMALLEASYPRELARLLEAPISGVRKALASLERDGLVAGREVGRTRLYRLNPSYFARRELREYLARLAQADPELHDRTAALRRRPRQSGKPL
jgi:DNA-binding transcriptional ArsR family regulator